jgi:hypothetical protein
MYRARWNSVRPSRYWVVAIVFITYVVENVELVVEGGLAVPVLDMPELDVPRLVVPRSEVSEKLALVDDPAV